MGLGALEPCNESQHITHGDHQFYPQLPSTLHRTLPMTLSMAVPTTTHDLTLIINHG